MAQKTTETTETRKRPSGRTMTLPLGGNANVTIHVPRVDPFAITPEGQKLLGAVMALVKEFGGEATAVPKGAPVAAPEGGTP